MVGSSSSSSVGPREQDLRERDAHLPAARQRADVVVRSARRRSRGRAGSPARAPRARSRRDPGSAPGPRRTASTTSSRSSPAASSCALELARARRRARRPRPRRRRSRRGSCGRAGRRRPGGSSRASACFGRSIAPSSGCSSPTISRNTVLLPAPLGPTSPTFSPGLIWNDASTNRIWPPYCLVTDENAITGRSSLSRLVGA